MTAREYFSLGETDERYELIDGVLVMSPSPTLPHQDIVRALLRQIEPTVDELPGVRIVLDTDIKFADDTVYRPDIAIYLPGRVSDETDYPDAAPDLIIEVVSPSSKARDLITKRDDYARFGVREYWVLDADVSAIHVFRTVGRARKYARPSLARTAVDSTAIPGIGIDLPILRDTLRRMSSAWLPPTSKRRGRR
jgi:Uma2 family endonuclease